jgi:hypothetical protein
MAVQELRDFSDIIDYCLESLGLQATDTVSKNRVKRIINSIYLDEVVPHKRWSWLKGHVQREHKPYYGSGTCEVTPDSTTVTLSAAPSVASGSRAGYKFAVNGFSEIYEVSTHTAGSATLVLTSPYTGIVSATARSRLIAERPLNSGMTSTMKIWKLSVTMNSVSAKLKIESLKVDRTVILLMISTAILQSSQRATVLLKYFQRSLQIPQLSKLITSKRLQHST